MTESSAPLQVLRVIDDRPGHRAQSAGLAAALGRHTATAINEWPAQPATSALRSFLCRGVLIGQRTAVAAPDLILCCGHQTHLTGLALRRHLGGRLIAMMTPSLPLAWFDLVIAPAHDAPAPRNNLMCSEGALNNMTAAGTHDPDRGVILIGGPSSHYGWDSSALLRQLQMVLERDPGRHWTLSTSRRTPPATATALASLNQANLTVVPLGQTGPAWVTSQLAVASRAWISEDSVSMVYEALTAGATVGILEVPRKRRGRVVEGMDRLCQARRALRWTDWVAGAPMPVPIPLAEADRAAQEILGRWFPERLTMDAA